MYQLGKADGDRKKKFGRVINSTFFDDKLQPIEKVISPNNGNLLFDIDFCNISVALVPDLVPVLR